MAARDCNWEYGVPGKVLQTDLVPDWNAAEVTTGVSVTRIRPSPLYAYWTLCVFFEAETIPRKILPCNTRCAVC